MAFQLTIALSFFVIFFIVSYKNDNEPNDSALLTIFSTIISYFISVLLALLLSVSVIYVLSTPKTSQNYHKLNTNNVTTTLTSGKKTLQLTDQTKPKDLKGFSEGTISLSDGQTTAKRKVDDITLVNSKHGSTIDHIEYGTKTNYRSYFGSSFNEEKTTSMRVVFKSDELNKRFGD